MAATFLRRLTGRERTVRANRQLGGMLAFVAGAINAGGFLAVGSYTSHMTGIVSSVADQLALGHWLLALTGLVMLLAFMLGAMSTALLANWARRRGMHSEYALSLMLEALLLMGFGLLGDRLDDHRELLVPATVVMLCYLMGLQNAVVTKISRSEIRTTHMTGIATDIGIELGKLVYYNRNELGPEFPPVRANHDKLMLLGSILGLFFVGGVSGALAFKRFGFSAALPLACLLVLLALLPIWDDLRRQRR